MEFRLLCYRNVTRRLILQLKTVEPPVELVASLLVQNQVAGQGCEYSVSRLGL